MKPASAVNGLALRGAIAAAAAILITTGLSLERPYWVIMVAVLLVNQTTAQSLQRAGERVFATLAGFALGWGLEWITKPHHWLQTAVMLAAIFLAVFFRQSWGRGSYPWMVFFISLYVVFLFALLGEWSPSIFVARVLDTSIGAAAAVFAAYIVRSPPAPRRLRHEAEGFWNNCRQQVTDALEAFRMGSETSHPQSDLLARLDRIRTDTSEALYESFLSRAARHTAREDLARAQMLGYFSLGFCEALACTRPAAVRGPIYRSLAGLLDLPLRAEFSEFMPPDRLEPGRPVPSIPEACELAANLGSAAGVVAEDRFWAIPALYYAAALRHRVAGAQTES